MAEIKVGQKYTYVGREWGSVQGTLTTITGISGERIDTAPGSWDFRDFFFSTEADLINSGKTMGYVLAEDVEEIEPLKIEHLKVGQLVIRKSDGWKRFITAIEGDQVTHKYGGKKMGVVEDTARASDFLEGFRLPDISEVAQFKKDNPEDFAKYTMGKDQEDYQLSPNEDMVNHPPHYTSDPSGIECIQITRHRNFNIGNAIKYLWRQGLKQDVDKSAHAKQIEDLKKAVFYIQDEIKRLES